MIDNQFIQVKTKANFESELSSGNIKDTSIAFIEDTDQIWAKGKYYSVVPKDGHERQILSWKASGEAKWEDLANVFTGLEEILAYGVQWDTTVSDPHLTRIGNMSLHKTLPIQSQLKGCIAQGNQVIYWLDENDWKWRKSPITQNMTLAITDGVYTIVNELFADNRYKDQWLRINNIPCKVTAIDTGSTTATLTPDEAIEAGAYDVELGAVLNGYDGTVRVYCPNFYIKSYSDGNIRKVYISTVKIDDSWTYQHEILVDAYRCTVLNTVPENMGYLSTLPVNSLISVVNTESYCRGGGNRTANDTYLATDPFRTDLGKPRTNINRATARGYARNASSELLSYEQYKNIFYWLWVIEYANFNSQEAFNGELTSEGYHQGGLGSGLTTVEYGRWYIYNYIYPLTPCGYGNSLGNNTGSIIHQGINFSGTPSITSSIQNYNKDATIATMTGTTTINITNILKSDTKFLQIPWFQTTGKVTYNITGLTEGQEIIFSTSTHVVATASTDGQTEVNWPTDVLANRDIKSNFTGECNISISIISAESVELNLALSITNIARWRGFDNPFGDIWTNLDGILINTPLAGASDTSILPTCYIITDPEKYTDSLKGIEEVADRNYKQPHSEGYIKEWHLGNTADIIPESIGGNTTLNKCDRYWVNYDDTPETLLVGGGALSGAHAGLGALYSNDGVSLSRTNAGFRSVSVFGS